MPLAPNPEPLSLVETRTGPTAGERPSDRYAAARREALAQIRKAKAAHMRWRAYAQALVSGVPIDDEKLPVEHTACAFGKWYHGEGLVALGHLDAYEGIATPHEMLHAIYTSESTTPSATARRSARWAA